MATLVPRQRETDEDRSLPSPTGGEESATVADTTLFRIGRALFGSALAFMALDNLLNLEERIGYAEAKGAPIPDVSVPAVSGGLFLGSIGVALWRVPSAAATAVAWFFVTVTPVMHDFWTLEDPEERQQQQIEFLKNTAILGAALAFLSLDRDEERSRT